MFCSLLGYFVCSQLINCIPCSLFLCRISSGITERACLSLAIQLQPLCSRCSSSSFEALQIPSGSLKIRNKISCCARYKPDMLHSHSQYASLIRPPLFLLSASACYVFVLSPSVTAVPPQADKTQPHLNEPFARYHCHPDRQWYALL